MTTTNPRRRRFQFRLRTLLVLMLLVSIGMGWFAMKMRQAKRRRAAVNAILDGGGDVSDWSRHFAPTYQGWQTPSQGKLVRWGQAVYDEESRAHAWIRWLLGDDFFTHPVSATIRNDVGMEHLDGLPLLENLLLASNQITDADLAHLKCLSRLQVLYIISNSITDAGLEHVKGISTLGKVHIASSQVSDSGMKSLQQMLPNCDTYHKK